MSDQEAEPSSGIGARVAALLAWADGLQRRHPVLGFPYAVVKKYGDDAAGKHAALITYYGFLSLFPLLLVVVVLVTRVLANNPELRADVIANIIPQEFQQTVDEAVTSLPTGGLPLVIGLGGLLFSASGIIFSIHDTLNHLAAVPHRDRYGTLPRYLRGFAMLLVLVVGVVGIGALTVLSAELPDIGQASRVFSGLGVVAIAFGLLVVAPKVLIARRVPFSSVWVSGLVGALVVSALLLLFGPLLARFVSRSGPVYGSFATIVGLFALLYLVSQVLLYAAEVAVVRRARLWPRALVGDDPTPADERALALLARIEQRIGPEQITVTFHRDAGPATSTPAD